nr:helix-turn-helix domain-containing protein [Hoeflea halophila]
MVVDSPSNPEKREARWAIRFDLPLMCADIADFPGLTIETVSRRMTRLRQDDMILISNHRQDEVPNLTRLAERASQ